MSTYVISSHSTERAFVGALTDACTRVTIEGTGLAPASGGGPPARCLAGRGRFGESPGYS
jgi:hypothetical protein